MAGSPLTYVAQGDMWWSWSGFEDQVKGRLGRAPESAEAGLGEHLPQSRFPAWAPSPRPTS